MNIGGRKQMKRFIFMALLLMFDVPAFADGPVCVDAAYDAAIAYFEIADRVFVGTDGTYANKLGEVTIDGADLSAVNALTDGRSLQITAQDIVASGTGTADTMGLYDVGTTTVLAYWPTTEQPMESGSTYSFGIIVPITFRDITVTPE